MVLTTSKEVGLKVEVGIGFRNTQGQRRVKLGWLEELGMFHGSDPTTMQIQGCVCVCVKVRGQLN